MSALPPLDLHAHVDPAIPSRDLVDLQAVVFAVTRSLGEAASALERTDPGTCWGVGCHPGLVRAQQTFSASYFSELMKHTAFVSEIGLDGESRVPMSTQQATLGAILEVLQRSPRITSIHSYEAAEEVLESLETQPIKGAVLHWWLGDPAQTRRAVNLGCFFSINASSVRRTDLLDIIPLDRVLTETDHPFGDRQGNGHARPGGVDTVEQVFARRTGLSPEDVRSLVWGNLRRLVAEVGCADLLPRGIRLRLIAH